MPFKRVFSGAPWESKVGYCRAVKAEDHIFISGTAPVDDQGDVFDAGDGYAQAKRCLEIIDKTLRELGSSRSAVVRTRMFVTDISRWEEYGRAHGEFFAQHPPATSMVEVRSLIHEDMLIEIEVDAIQRVSD